ncbi:MAG: hypothetical protein ABI295_05680, partial [Xanthomarina sp.]
LGFEGRLYESFKKIVEHKTPREITKELFLLERTIEVYSALIIRELDIKSAEKSLLNFATHFRKPD